MIAPTACYFPWTDITPAGLNQALCFFRKIILYRLPGDQPGEHLVRAVEAGMLELVEVDFIADQAELKRVMADFAKWADMYRDPAYLSLLKNQPLRDTDETASRLMTAIRGRWSDPALKREPARDAQVFLHFARHLDRQREEVRELLARVETRENGLSRIMGVGDIDREEDGLDPAAPAGPKLSAMQESGVELMPQRLAAWAHLLSHHGRGRTALFTDRPQAASQLDMNLVRRVKSDRAIGAGRNMDVLEPFIRLTVPAPPPGMDIAGLEPWRLKDDNLFSLLTRIAEKPWNPEELPLLRTEAEAMVKAMHLEKPADSGPALTLTGYMLPGADLAEAYRAAAGLADAPVKTDAYCGPLFEICAE